MKVHLYVEIQGSIDSYMLWELIRQYNLDLTDLGKLTMVYGDCSYSVAGRVVSRCALFGNLTVKITRGCKNEQKEAED